MQRTITLCGDDCDFTELLNYSSSARMRKLPAFSGTRKVRVPTTRNRGTRMIERVKISEKEPDCKLRMCQNSGRQETTRGVEIETGVTLRWNMITPIRY